MKFIWDDELAEIGGFQGQKILIADDNDLNLQAIKVILEDRGLQVDAVFDGEAAVQKYLESQEHEYQMVLLDINMAGMDGYEAAERIRQSNRADSEMIAIYAVSANILPEHRERSREAGMNGYILKPVEYPSLLRLIKRELMQRQGSGVGKHS